MKKLIVAALIGAVVLALPTPALASRHLVAQAQPDGRFLPIGICKYIPDSWMCGPSGQ